MCRRKLTDEERAMRQRKQNADRKARYHADPEYRAKVVGRVGRLRDRMREAYMEASTGPVSLHDFEKSPSAQKE
jgi:hypothetical protein